MLYGTPVKPCPTCHGRRTDGNGHLCATCQGAGELPEPLTVKPTLLAKSKSALVLSEKLT
jgi:DnaJ-class molecular chaperone